MSTWGQFEAAHLRAAAVKAASYSPADRYIPFELSVPAAGCNGYGDIALPGPARWSAPAA
jgi:hypothetical protein